MYYFSQYNYYYYYSVFHVFFIQQANESGRAYLELDGRTSRQLASRGRRGGGREEAEAEELMRGSFQDGGQVRGMRMIILINLSFIFYFYYCFDRRTNSLNHGWRRRHSFFY